MNTDQAHVVQELLKRRDFASARSILSEMRSKDPKNAEVYYLVGVMQYFQGQIPETIHALKKCLELNPKHTDAAICLSVLHNDLGQYEEGRRVFEAANQSVLHLQPGEDLNIDRKFCIKHLELGDLYLRYRRFDEAIEQYTRAMVLDPSDLEIRIRRAKAQAKKGFVTRAIQDLEQLKKQHPTYLAARLQLGLLHYSQGNVLDAELEWESVTQSGGLSGTTPSTIKEARAYLEMARRGQPASRVSSQSPLSL